MSDFILITHTIGAIAFIIMFVSVVVIYFLLPRRKERSSTKRKSSGKTKGVVHTQEGGLKTLINGRTVNSITFHPKEDVFYEVAATDAGGMEVKELQPLCRCEPEKRKAELMVVHIFENEDVVSFSCLTCGGMIAGATLSEIMKQKSCYCCYCKQEKGLENGN